MSKSNQINVVALNTNQNENQTSVNNSDNMEFDFSLCFEYYYSCCLC